MTWVLLTIAAIVSRAVFGVLTKIMSGRVPASSQTIAVIVLLGAGVVSLVLSPLLGGLSTDGVDQHWVLLLVTVIASAVGNIMYFRGLQELESSIAQIAFSSIIAWGAVLSVVMLNSHFDWWQLMGAAGLVLAIVISQFDGRFRVNAGVWFILLSAVCFAVFQVGSARYSDDITAATYLVVTYFGAGLVISLAYRQRMRNDMRSLRPLARELFAVSSMTAVMSMAYFAFAYYAYSKAPDPGVVVLLLTSQVVLAVLLSALVLKERKNLRNKVLGGVLAALSGALIRH